METDKMKYLCNIPARREDSHKGTYGKILIAAGSCGMCGAAVFAGLAAYRSGAGLVRILTHQENRIIIQTMVPEAFYTGYDEHTDFVRLSSDSVSWADVIVVGPGLGTGGLSVTLLREILNALIHLSGTEEDAVEAKWLKKSPMLLIDADGLNILSTHPDLIKKVDTIARWIPVIVTPHALEMARLSSCSLDDVLTSLPEAAATFARKHGTVTVMKGAETVIMDAREHAFRNLEPSPALSKGGSGDVLSGAIAGIYAVLRADRSEKLSTVKEEQGKKSLWYQMAFDATVTAVLVHAEAGRQAARIHGTHAVFARETADMLGIVMEKRGKA